nr:minor capsid protein [Bacillus mycoides]
MAEVESYVKSLVPHTYYAYSFPTTGRDDSVVILINGGFPTEETGVRRPSIQLLVRGTPNDKAGAEEMAYRLYDAMKFKRDFMIGETSVVEMKAMQSAPTWTGEDGAKRPIFSLNFETTIRN